uniref:TSC22 domain family protein 1-like n=1 Tax=Steinernema glaseri TaxID=37863 RepID=A0A1I7YTR6_9BILA
MQCAVPQVHHLSEMFHDVWWGDEAKKHARAPSLDYDVEVASIDSSPSSNPSGPNSQIVAIDHKIEQAMDLVKTHLMFAVREEVDVLRSRIMELETTVIQLEAENAILREHVPEEILAKMNMQSSV